jgi:hypothetical protein
LKQLSSDRREQVFVIDGLVPDVRDGFARTTGLSAHSWREYSDGEEAENDCRDVKLHQSSFMVVAAVCRLLVMPQALTPVLNKKAFEEASVRTRTQLAEVALEETAEDEAGQTHLPHTDWPVTSGGPQACCDSSRILSWIEPNANAFAGGLIAVTRHV